MVKKYGKKYQDHKKYLTSWQIAKFAKKDFKNIFLQTMESCIKQNNAIEIYQDYFNEIDEATDCEEPKAKVKLKVKSIIIA